MEPADIQKLRNELSKAGECTINGSNIRVSPPAEELQNTLKGLGYEVRVFGSDPPYLEFEPDKDEIEIRLNAKHFWQSIFLRVAATYSFTGYSDDKDIVILFFSEAGEPQDGVTNTDLKNTSSLFYRPKDNETWKNGILAPGNPFFLNISSYLQFIAFLNSRKEFEEGGKFRFTDNFDQNNKTVTFLSLKKDGELIFTGLDKFPIFPLAKSISKGNDDLRNAFSKNDKKFYHPTFIKSAIFERFTAFDSPARTVSQLFLDLESICSAADESLGLFMYDLTLDKYKKEFLDLKAKYFGALRDVLGKISTQVIGLPIAVSAVALATYGFKDIKEVTPEDIQQLIKILAAAFFIYSIFASSLLGLYWEDISDTAGQTNDGFRDLFSQEFFQKVDRRNDFQLIKDSIDKRVLTMRMVLCIYLFLLASTNSLLLSFLLSKLQWPVWLVIIFFLLHFLFFFFKINWGAMVKGIKARVFPNQT